MRTRFEKQNRIGLFERPVEYAPHVGPSWDSLPESRREDLDSIMAAYAGCIDSIDQNIGKLTSHLRSIEKWDNTLLFFLSDNGACQEGGDFGRGSEKMVRNPPPGTAGVRLGLCWANACNVPFRKYKHYVHEGGMCTPLIVHWPAGIAENDRGTFVREMAYLPDFLSTCIDLSGGSYPQNLPEPAGSSMLPLIQGSDKAIHTDPIFWEHEGNAAVRWGKWKLVREYEQPWELYNIETDRSELNDLARTHPEKVKQLVHLWENWARGIGVEFPERFNMYQYLRQREQGRQ